MLNSTQDPNRILEKKLFDTAYNSIHKFDMIFLSETYLDSNLSSEDSNFKISEYNLVRSDHPPNKQCGGVCICCKICLPLRIIDINYLNECANGELI